MPSFEINLENVSDGPTQENFLRIREHIENDLFTRFLGKHFEVQLEGTLTQFRYRHHLGFVPRDILETSRIGAALTWHYDLFDETHLVVSTTGDVRVRAFIGTFRED